MPNGAHSSYNRNPSYRPVSYQSPDPHMTYVLLGTMGAFFVIQLATAAYSSELHNWIFVIASDWYLRPWSVITSTLAHGGLTHILFNGMFLFFFGPSVEQILGPRRFATVFFVAGAVSGISQVYLETSLFGGDGAALGASGALMAILGLTIVFMPNAKAMMLLLPIPIPIWVLGIGYAFLDIIGAFNPADGIGNFAHLSGMVYGLAYGTYLREKLRQRGLRISYR